MSTMFKAASKLEPDFITRCDFVASGLGMQKVRQGVFCGRNVIIFSNYFDNLTVLGYLDNLVRKFA
jgi:hypothetical protein